MVGLRTGLTRIRRMIKRMLPRTLFGRSLIIAITPIIVLQIIATYVFYERHWDTVADRMAKSLGGEIGMVIEALQATPDEADRRRFLEIAKRRMHLDIAYLPGERMDLSRARNSSMVPFGALEETLTDALRGRLVEPFRVDTRSLPDQVMIRVQLDDGVLRVVTRDKRVFSSTTYMFIVLMVGSSIILMTVAVIFLRNQMRPIHRLAKAADGFGKGREVADFRPSGAKEVRQAAHAFLRMRERIHRQITQRTEMLAGVSHDLRTPLTRMKLQLAMLGNGSEVSDLKSDVDEMERMVEGYLSFARGQDREPAVDIDLPNLLGEVVSDARRQGSAVDLRTEGPITIPVRPNALKRCITNLVENARRHAKTIVITARRTANAVEIAVDDDGPGIPVDEREAAFRPFHRLEGSRNRETGGSGLGLTIALDVARSHGGELTLGDAPSGGLRALVRLPV